jgi:two-component system, cell cycle sensor histidine kinase and response regulator CckA
MQRDADEQRRQELALSEDRYRRLFDQNIAGTFRATGSGELLECNDAFARIFGFAARDEAVGVHLRSLYADPDAYDNLVAELEDKQATLNRELCARRRDGSKISISLSASLLRYGDGRKFEVEGTLLDISESRCLRRQLAQAQKMEAIGQLAGRTAHDFNNVLMVIGSYAEFLREAVSENPRLTRYTDSILKAAESAASLNQQLLALSRKPELATAEAPREILTNRPDANELTCDRVPAAHEEIAQDTGVSPSS